MLDSYCTCLKRPHSVCFISEVAYCTRAWRILSTFLFYFSCFFNVFFFCLFCFCTDLDEVKRFKNFDSVACTCSKTVQNSIFDPIHWAYRFYSKRNIYIFQTLFTFHCRRAASFLMHMPSHFRHNVPHFLFIFGIFPCAWK